MPGILSYVADAGGLRASPFVGGGGRDLAEPRPLEDRPGELGRVAVDVALPVADRRAGPGGGQGPVNPPAPELGAGRPTPDAGELGALDGFEPAGTDDLAVVLGD